MATEMVRQTNFKLGEVDSIHFKRTDLEDYLTAAQSLLNCEISTTWAIKKRKGTKHLITIDTITSPVTANSRLFEFADKFQNYYLVLLTNHLFTVYSIDPSTGALTLFEILANPYDDADIPFLDFSFDNSVLVFAHNKYPPARLYVTYMPTTFIYSVLDIYPLPSFDFGNINYNNFTVAFTNPSLNTFKLQFIGLLSDPGFTAEWIGGVIIGTGPSATEPIGYGIITSVIPFPGLGGTVEFDGVVVKKFGTISLFSTGAQFSIKQPVFTTALGFPSTVLFYQNRLWFGNTPELNNTVFGSKINAPINFDVGIGLDTDAIVYTIGQGNSGQVINLNGGKQLEIFTENNEFACPQEPNSALTPSTFSIRYQSSYGSSFNLKPITYSNDSYYISKNGNSIISYQFDGIGQTYTSTNISQHAQHLVKNPLNRCLLRGSDVSQDNFVYYLNDDSTLVTFQFSDEYKLAALTPTKFSSTKTPGNLVQVIDIVTIHNEVYFLKHLINSGKFVIEKFVNDIKMDSYMNATMDPFGTITGLQVLSGYSIQVLFNNQDYGIVPVDNTGTALVDDPLGSSGPVTVGLLYDVNITPMYTFSGVHQSDYHKYVTRIYVDYFQSLNFSINGQLVPYQQFSEVQMGLPPSLKSGTAIVNPVRGWNVSDIFSIQQTSPYDLNIISISYQVSSSIV